MMHSLGNKFILAIATTGISLATIAASPTQAATVGYNFDLYVVDGLLAGYTGKGSFTYDDSTLTGKGWEFLGKQQGLSVQLNFLGNSYTEANDVNDNDDPSDKEPLVNFSNGNLLGLNLSLLKSDEGPLILIRNRSFDIPNYGSRQIIGYGSVKYTKQVPEPGSVLGVGALGVAWLIGRQKKLSATKKDAAKVS